MTSNEDSLNVYKVEKSNLPHIRNYYRFGAFILFIILFINFYINNSMLSTQNVTADLINISGRQRMLSQRIALLSNLVVNSIYKKDSFTYTLYNTELSELIVEMQESHDHLFNGVLSDETITNSKKIVQMYTSKPTDLNNRLRLYLNAASIIQRTQFNTNEIGKREISINLTYLNNNSRSIAGSLNTIVIQYQNEVSQEIESIKTTQTLLFITVIAIISIELWAIFVPLESRIKQREAYLVQQINERNKAEYKLRKTEYNYRLLAANLPNLSVMLFDRDMRFILADGPFLKRSGYEKDWVEGKTLQEVIGDRYELFVDHYKEALAGKSNSFEGKSLAGAYYRTQILPTINSRGEITGGMVVSEDISDYKKALFDLKEVETRFHQLADNIDTGFWLASADAQEVYYLNDALAHIYSQKFKNMVNNPNSFTSTIHPEDVHISQENRIYRIHNNQYNVEYRVIDSNGNVRWLWSKAFPVRDENGEIIRTAGIVQDITERKKLEQKAVQLGIEQNTIKLLSDFIRDTAHDLKTPLTIISTSSYLLKKTTDTKEQHRHIEIINRQVLHLKSMIEQLHSMSHIDVMSNLDYRKIELNDIVRSVHKIILPRANAKDIQIEFELGEGPYEILGDENYMFKAIYGIYENAILYTKEHGHVEISTYIKENDFIIQIKDDGIGIANDEIDKIFNRFYKVNTARTSNTSGSGLGLTMSKLIIEKHSGVITVESLLGVGSTFKVKIPVNQNISLIVK